MLNSNQACDVIFKIEHLQKLSVNRLKKFKQSCERFQNSFEASCCEIGCETAHIKTNFVQYIAFGGYRTLEDYNIWSTNMTNIRATLKINTQLQLGTN